MYISKKTILIVLFFSILTNSGFSKTTNKKTESKKIKKTKPYKLTVIKEEITVTAKMSPILLKDCSSSVSIINSSDIKAICSSNALNILGNFSGIFVNKTGDFGRSDVDIRGLGQNCRQIAVLVDGKPEKMGLYGCSVSHSFPLDNVDHIEVIKGPASVLYGGEALGGVINIITKVPKGKFESDISASYGSYNTQQFNLKHGGNHKKLTYFLTYDNRKSDGHIENTNYSGRSFTGRLIYRLDNNAKINFQGKYFDGKKFESGTLGNPQTNFWNDYKRGSISMNLLKKWEKNDFSLNIYRNFGTHKFSDGWDSKDYTNGAIAKYTLRSIKNNELTVGTDLRYFGGESFNYPKGNWKKKEGSIFFQNEFILHSKWILSSGLRLQFDSLFGKELSPHFGIVYQVNSNTVLRGVINKGFRSPQLNELYMYPPANQDLKPEIVWNHELGFEHNIGRRIIIKGAVFNMKGTNMIRIIRNQNPGPMYIFSNSGSFSFTGYETELDFHINRNFSGQLSYTHMNYKDLTKGKPGEKWDISLRYSKRDFLVSFQAQYVSNYYAEDFSKRGIPPYFLLNSRFVVPILKKLNLIIDMNNLLNKNYCIYGEFPGLSAGLYQMPDRNIQIGFNYRPN